VGPTFTKTSSSADPNLALTVIEDMRIPLTGGLSLSARVWMPQTAVDTPFPAIIEYIPYRRRDGTIARDEQIHPFIARQGYVCLRIDLRGSGDSDGLLADEYTVTELTDACDVIAWIAAQPWCSGAVGMMGKSWGGFNALQTAALAPPALKAVVAGYTTTDRFADDIHYKGGCLLGDNLRWGAVMLAYSARPPDPLIRPDDWRAVWQARLTAEPFLTLNWLAHQRRDGYWRHGSVCERYKDIQAAVLVFAGWADNYMNAPAHLLTGLEGPVTAIIGPWGHQYPHMAAPEPRIDFLHQMLEWWDHWLKGRDTGADRLPALRYFQQGSVRPRRHYHSQPGLWRAEQDWPSQRVTIQTLTLTSAHGLLETTHTPDQTAELLNLMIATPQQCGLSAGEYFPMAIATDDHNAPGPPERPGDQRSDDALSLCFDSPPLDQDTALLGAATFHLRLSSATPQAQIFVRLCDVHPDGASTRIAHGMLNLAHRDSFSDPAPLVPDKPYDITVTLDQTSYVLPAGHRLRLALSTSYFPFVWPSPEAARLTVYSGHLDLPVHQDPHPPEPEVTFGPPEALPPWPGEGLRASRYNRQIHQDLATGHVSLTITTDSGRSRDLRHGLVTDTLAKEVWSVHPDDPLSARADISWTQLYQRDEVEIQIDTGAAMTSDQNSFFLTGYIRAYEGSRQVFEKQFDQAVPRDNR